MAASAGSWTFILLATSPIALMKQADQPAANNCSGLVPVPGTPGAENLTSKRPSSLLDTPPRRPPEVWVLAVYLTVAPSWAGSVTMSFDVCSFVLLRGSGHHLPACAPPSTCSISPEVK